MKMPAFDRLPAAGSFGIRSVGLILLLGSLLVRWNADKPQDNRSLRVRPVSFQPDEPQPPNSSTKPPAGAAANPKPASDEPPSPLLLPFRDDLGPKIERSQPPRLYQKGNTAQEIVSNLVGAKTCAECHPGEHAMHFGSGHARTLKPAGKTAVAAKLENRLFRDTEERYLLWRYVVSGNRLEASQFKDGKWTCLPLDFAVGSGQHGMTFMSLQWDEKIKQYKGIEHRLSYYTSSDHMDVTPGQGERDSGSDSFTMSDQGRVMDKASLFKCLDCHTTLTSTRQVGEVDPTTMIPNISCERCHGPGREHVEAARKGATGAALEMTLGTNATAQTQIRECGTCHRRIDTLPPSQFHEDNHELARFQPVGIQASACFEKGKSGLKCTTCHDPHGKVSHDRASYVNACLSCHGPSDRKVCKIEPKGDCINCHMPKRTVSEVFEFTDHWIRKPKKAK